MGGPSLPELNADDLRALDAICNEFEQAWREGRRPRAADFLGSFTGPKRNELARQLLEVEFERRVARSEIPNRQEYDTAFPELADWIQQRLNQMLQTVTVPSQTSQSDAVLIPDPAHVHEDPLLGRTFGKYAIVERLGTGGMGAVYRARHTMIHCERALKLLRPNLARDADAVQRFLREAQACIELSHPHIVTTYHVDQEEREGAVYIVMELLQGENLSQLVNRVGPLPVAQAATIIQQAAKGLAFAHQRGTVHRDIKPHNIMWTTSGAAKILDLGLARLLDEEQDVGVTGDIPDAEIADRLLTRYQSRLTGRDSLVGTLPYMAPEQAASARDADARSDIYSLGCTFYFLLTGKHAFVGESPGEILQKHLAGDFVPLQRYRRDLSTTLHTIVERMMSRDRQRRYSSATEVVEVLGEWLNDPAAEPSPAPGSQPVGLDDPQRLRDELIRLRVVSREEWDQAEQAARQLREQSTLSGSILITRPPALDASQILEQLQGRADESAPGLRGLSEFQLRHVLKGDQDLLRLPHHVLRDQRGQGWKGGVFEARNVEVDRVEILRTFSPQALQGLEGDDSERTAAFLAFVDRLAKLDHPAIPRVYGGGRFRSRRQGPQVYLATQFVPGESLAEVVRGGSAPRGEPADVAWCVRMARDVCLALDHAHQRGILHLDVHGLSLRLDEAGGIHVLDLGVAMLLTRRPSPSRAAGRPAATWGASRTRSGASRRLDDTEELSLGATTSALPPPPLGTPNVTPPEQWQNGANVSVATDIYNVGCTLFYMITGRYPFQSASTVLELMRQHLEQPPLCDPMACLIPEPLHPILDRALAKSPQDRFATAREFAAALEELLALPPDRLQWRAELGSTADAPTSWLGRLGRWLRR